MLTCWLLMHLGRYAETPLLLIQEIKQIKIKQKSLKSLPKNGRTGQIANKYLTIKLEQKWKTRGYNTASLHSVMI